MSKVNRIQSRQNRLLKHWKKLQKSKERRKAQTFFIEGEHLLKEAIASNLTMVACIVMEEKWSWFRSRFAFDQIDSPIYLLPASIFHTLMETETPQGIAAEVRFPNRVKQEQTFSGDTYLLLDAIQDPGNLGTIIRTAEATNVDEIWLGKGSVDPTNAKVIRAAMGSSFRVLTFQECLDRVIPQMKRQGIQVIGTSPRATHPYYAYPYADRVAFLFGNEGRGVDPKLRALVDDEVMIPMHGKTESLNVSVTASILLYERLRQRSVTCKGDQHSI